MKYIINYLIPISAVIIIHAFLSACRKAPPTKFLPVEYSDPYRQSFRDKNIRYVVMENPDAPGSRPDTFELDREGNIIRTREFWTRWRYKYDHDGFLVQKNGTSDIWWDYVLRYSTRGDTLIQSWREYTPGREWDDGTDTTTTPLQTILYRFNDRGKVIWEDGLSYVYSDEDILLMKVYDGLDSAAGWFYEYDQAMTIKKITMRHPSGWSETQYFTNGTLDSTIRIDWNWIPYKTRRKCRYVYY